MHGYQNKHQCLKHFRNEYFDRTSERKLTPKLASFFRAMLPGCTRAIEKGTGVSDPTLPSQRPAASLKKTLFHFSTLALPLSHALNSDLKMSEICECNVRRPSFGTATNCVARCAGSTHYCSDFGWSSTSAPSEKTSSNQLGSRIPEQLRPSNQVLQQSDEVGLKSE